MSETDINALSNKVSGGYPNALDTDFRTEVVVTSLIEQGYDPEQIQIIRQGIARRGIAKDVEDIYQKFSTDDLSDYLYVETNREGVYDMLPQGIFHQPVFRKNFVKSKEEALEEIRIHRDQEFFARKFFRLFEDMADKTLIDAFLYEARYDRKISYPEFIRLFEPHWPALKMLGHKQAVFFMHIIPIFHKIRTSYAHLSEAFSYILDAPVKITEIILPVKKGAHDFESCLERNNLGDDFVLGDRFDDGEYDLKITVGPIPAFRMLDFLETAKGNQILDEICELFLPADRFIVKNYKLLPQDSEFILSNDDSTTFLGINSFI